MVLLNCQQFPTFLAFICKNAMKCWQASKPELPVKRLCVLPLCIVRIRRTSKALHLIFIYHSPPLNANSFNSGILHLTLRSPTRNSVTYFDWKVLHALLQSEWLMFCVIVYFSGLIQLSADVFFAQLSMSLHTSFVCNSMWYTTRLNLYGGSIWRTCRISAAIISVCLFPSLRNVFGCACSRHNFNCIAFMSFSLGVVL